MSGRLRAGIIAAGRGDRLRHGSAVPKPLVRVGGRTLIERVLESIGDAGAAEVVAIVNEDSLAVRDHVEALRWIVETTPSSMHSFLRVVEMLAESGDDGPFLVSTVDTVAPNGAYATFAAEAAHHADAAVVLAVAPITDDEKPLLVRLDGSDVIALGDAAAPAEYATAGYYAVRSAILREANAARADNVGALRTFLNRLLARGYPIAAVRVPLSIDVDRPTDVDAAEDLLRRVTL